MAKGNIKDQGLARVIEHLCSIDSVTCADQTDDGALLELSTARGAREIRITMASGDYRVQKTQYERLREILVELGVEEGAIYTPPPPPRRGMTPQIRAAREAQRRTFEAWQEAWRTIRKAEKALDVEYEIAQMKDYY